MPNPLLTQSNSDFGIPPFKDIQTEHYLDAINELLTKEQASIESIALNSDPASFENTFIELEKAQRPLQQAAQVFGNLAHSNSDDDMRAAQKIIVPKLAEHQSWMMMHEALFIRIDAVHERRDELDDEAARLVEVTHKEFVRGGAKLAKEEKVRLKEIVSQLSEHCLQFSQNLVQENSGFELHLQHSDLGGLPEDVIERAQKLAKSRGHTDGYCFIPERSSLTPFLTYSTSREHRKSLYEAYLRRGDNGNEHDNNALCLEIAKLRSEQAQILGFPTYAAYSLDDTMAKTPKAVYGLLDDLWGAAKTRFEQEKSNLEELAKSLGQELPVEAWDWWYLSEKLRKEKYALDEETLSAYFSLDSVFAGVREVARRLFGITLHELPKAPKYHEDVRVYEVKDADGAHLSIFMTDYHQREGKAAGAWMTNFRDQEGDTRPIVANVCNFPKPLGGKPVLLSQEQVRTLFHEFGHALHGMLSNVQYRSLSGTSVSRDFVEFPSQILEHWAFHDDGLAIYAKHYETGESLPQELRGKMRAASTFNQGFANTEYLAAALLDLAWHGESNGLTETPNFEKTSLDKMKCPTSIAPRYRSANFAHIFSGPGYAAGYYSYIWSAVLDCDGFAAFEETGDIFNRDLANAYAKTVLQSGNLNEGMETYKAFRGREPQVDALMKSRGLRPLEV